MAQNSSAITTENCISFFALTQRQSKRIDRMKAVFGATKRLANACALTLALLFECWVLWSEAMLSGVGNQCVICSDGQ